MCPKKTMSLTKMEPSPGGRNLDQFDDLDFGKKVTGHTPGRSLEGYSVLKGESSSPGISCTWQLGWVDADRRAQAPIFNDIHVTMDHVSGCVWNRSKKIRTPKTISKFPQMKQLSLKKSPSLGSTSCFFDPHKRSGIELPTQPEFKNDFRRPCFLGVGPGGREGRV